MSAKVYLAGPDVFFPDAGEVGMRKEALCRTYGFEGLFPGDAEAVDLGAAEIFLANRALMDEAEFGLFNLTPFRGPSADAGTVFEVGFMYAKGKRLYGYTSSTLSYRESLGAIEGNLGEWAGRTRDREGHAVEDFGLFDNLMIDRAIRESGGDVIAVEEEGPARFMALGAFEKALELLHAHVSDGR